MASIPEDILPERIRARLTTRMIGCALTVVSEIGSTNEAAMAAGHAGAPEGLCLLADRQTSGRGRLNRTWSSLPGLGVYTSILLRPAVPPDRAPILTLMAGCAVVEAIRTVAAVQPQLKWPNDVLLEGKKVAGILTEMATLGSRVSHVVVGIGINVNHRATDFPPEVRATATSLALAGGRPVDRGEVILALYGALERWYRLHGSDGAAMILESARRAMATLGRDVVVQSPGAAWQGKAVDLDQDGALLVRDATGTVQRVIADDVSIREGTRS